MFFFYVFLTLFFLHPSNSRNIANIQILLILHDIAANVTEHVRQMPAIPLHFRENLDGEVGSEGRVVTTQWPHMEDPTAQELQDLPPAVQADAALHVVGAQPPDTVPRIVGYRVNSNYLGFPV